MLTTLRPALLRIALCLAILSGSALACTSTGSEETPQSISPTSTSTPKQTASTRATRTPKASPVQDTATPQADVPSSGGTWLVMLYQDADDEILEEDIFTDLNEAERVGSNDAVSIVAQIDRYKGGFKGKQNFSGARRYYLTQDDDLEKINSEQIADLGEVNMADGQTLYNFVTWAVETYPADHYALILSDHGSGWPGGWTDADFKSPAKNTLIDGFDDMLYLNELDDTLAKIQEKTGIEKLDLIGLDACLMSSLEVLSSMAPYAQYAVVSQETEPSMGWAYTAFLKKLAADPSMQASTLSKDIVDSYINEDTLIVDDAARARYISRNYEGGENMSALQLAKEESKTVTLTAVDLSALPNVISSLDDLAQAMSKINQKVVANARSHTRAFESVFGDDYPSPYIDLGNFAKLVKKESTSERVGQAADALGTAIKKAVLAEKHGASKKGATGISIYFPNSTLFGEAGSDYATYSRIADRFASESLWDDFLTFHYTGQPLAADNKPKANTRMVGPGAEKIKMAPIDLSGDVASKDHPVTMSTTITGKNLSYIYVFTGRLNSAGDALQVVDIDYIDSDTTREVDGVIYPDWGGKEVPVDMDWEPLHYVIRDGTQSLPALLQPDTYGAGLEDTIYTVDGLYSLVSGEPRRFARLYFSGEGSLLRVMGYMGEDDKGPQHEITPQAGDKFTILDPWISLGENAASGEKNAASATTTKEAGTLTFGTESFTWEEATAPNGEYVIGYIAEDMDGNTYEEYASVTVK
jgi:hypothetical protein